MFKKILTIAIMVSLSIIFVTTAYSEDLDDLNRDVDELENTYIADDQPQIFTTVEELVWSFDTDPGLAALEYFEKTVQVCGIVSEINLKDNSISMLTDVGIRHCGVKCHIQDGGFDNNKDLKVGDIVTIQGEVWCPLKNFIELYNCFVIY